MANSIRGQTPRPRRVPPTKNTPKLTEKNTWTSSQLKRKKPYWDNHLKKINNLTTTLSHPQGQRRPSLKPGNASRDYDRVDSHQEFTEECLRKNLTPRGLQVKLKCNALLPKYSNVRDRFTWAGRKGIQGKPNEPLRNHQTQTKVRAGRGGEDHVYCPRLGHTPGDGGTWGTPKNNKGTSD